MRVFSRSAGKVIDVADQGSVSTPQQTGLSRQDGAQEAPSQDAAMTSVGIPDTDLRNAFFRLGLSNPKSINNLKSLYDLVAPEKSGPTAEMRNRREALKPAKSALGRIDDETLNQLGPQNLLSRLSLRFGGGFGVPDTVLDLNSKFELLRQNVVRALQGARMSDADIKTALGYIPQITDTSKNARIKIKNLNQFIEDLQGTTNTTPSQTNYKILNVSEQ